MTNPASAPVLTPRPIPFAFLAVTGVLASGLLGMLTNVVNGLVSPEYFRAVMRWSGSAEEIWLASIAQGAFEGVCFGVVFSLIFTTGTGVITSIACTYRFAVKHLLGVLAGAFVGWILGGALGVGLAALNPQFFAGTFGGVPTSLGPRLAFAWVGGSIWGVQLGGLASVVLGLVVMRSNWQRFILAHNLRVVPPQRFDIDRVALRSPEDETNITDVLPGDPSL